MDTLAQIKARNQVTLTVDGIPFVCRKPSAVLALEAFGAGCLMIVNEGTPDQRIDLDASQAGDSYEQMQKYLKVAMITPSLGDEDDEDAETVTWRTLGDLGPEIFNQLMGSTNDEVAAFVESSEVQKE